MRTIDINVKIEEEMKAIKELEEKRKKLDERISSKQKKVAEYKKMLQAKQYTDIGNQLDTLGISREDLLNALISGDLASLQDKIENEKNKTVVEASVNNVNGNTVTP